jgi:hypothetical protein
VVVRLLTIHKQFLKSLEQILTWIQLLLLLNDLSKRSNIAFGLRLITIFLSRSNCTKTLAKFFPTHDHLCCESQVKIQDASSCASRVAKTKTSAKGVAPAENRRNSNSLPGESNVYETTNSRGMNQAQITAEKNKHPNANKDTDHSDDEQSEGTQSKNDNPSDDSSEEETLEELVAKAKTSRINSGREI